MKQAIDRLKLELTAARLEYERYEKICQNPYATENAWREKYHAFGKWSGIAKAIECLWKTQKDLTTSHGEVN